MNKKFLVVLLFLALLIAGYLAYSKSQWKLPNLQLNQKPEAEMPTSLAESAIVTDNNDLLPTLSVNGVDGYSTGSETARTQLPNATITVPGKTDTTVILINGMSDQLTAESEPIASLIPEQFAEKKTSEGSDLFGVVNVRQDDGNYDRYLVLFTFNNGKLEQKDSVLLGTNVNIRQIGVSDVAGDNADYAVIVEMVKFDGNTDSDNTVDVKATINVKTHQFVK
jgi:hypothetical protein